MRADGVEVAQEHDVPALVRHVQVAQHLLVHRLGAAVGVRCRLEGRVLGHRHVVGLAVDRGRGREHNVAHAVVAHGAGHRQRAAQVVLVVLDGLVHRLAHRLVGGEVDDAVDVVLLEDAVEQGGVADVPPIEGADLPARDALDAAQGLLAGVGEVVDHHDLVARLEQLDAGVAADEAGTAGHQDAALARGACARLGAGLAGTRIRCHSVLPFVSRATTGTRSIPEALKSSGIVPQAATRGNTRHDARRQKRSKSPDGRCWQRRCSDARAPARQRARRATVHLASAAMPKPAHSAMAGPKQNR